MGRRYTLRWMRGAITGFVLLTVLATTFLPTWTPRSQAAPVSEPAVESAPDVSPDMSPDVDLSASTANPAASHAPAAEPVALAPLDALVISEAGRADELIDTIHAAGGYVYVREGDALFAGLNSLDEAALVPAGARAVYDRAVPGAELSLLAGNEYAAASAWNNVISAPPVAATTAPTAASADTVTLVPPTAPTANRSALIPTDEQTSVFLAGEIAVKVVFVESTGTQENWTETEVAKVKGEVLNALDWWTTTAVAPESAGADPRPTARLTWNVSVASPFDGSTTDRSNIRIGQEPITGSISLAATSWIPEIAARFTGMPASDAAVRRWAHITRQAALTDWGFVLFVVDSSSDADGRFDVDGKAGGAMIAGPWAVVTYDAGDRGVDNLEVLIAKMIGHVFGAGDESYDSSVPTAGCRNDERYGYFRIEHSNCEQDNPDSVLSLMRSVDCSTGICEDIMLQAYNSHQLSESARDQVGWRDQDSDGVYDVLDTLSDTFGSGYFSSPPICPTLHLANVAIDNRAPMPLEEDLGPWQFDGDTNGDGVVDTWALRIWNPLTQGYAEDLVYNPANINRVGYVWGRINDGEWVEADPSDGLWNSETESYNISLVAQYGVTNSIEIALMNRWEREVYLSDPVTVTLAAPPSTLNVPYQSDDTAVARLYNAAGAPGGWAASTADPGYSPGGPGSITMQTGAVGSEGCFAFSGDEVTILHSTLAGGGTASVYVDGDMHSTIDFSGAPVQQVPHLITNLGPGNHGVQIMSNGGGIIDFDAFVLTDSTSATMIDADPTTGNLPPGSAGFIENTDVTHVLYAGEWNATTISNGDRPGTPDSSAHLTLNAYDRVYAHFINADTVAIYRTVSTAGGSADVYLDGEYRGTMYNYARTEMVTPFYISGLSSALSHTVEVRSNQNADGTASPFKFDAFRFLNLRNDASLVVADAGNTEVEIGSTAPQEIYGAWAPITGGRVRSRNDGDLHTVYFKGSAIAIRRSTGGGFGLLEMYVDGRLIRTIDNRAAGSNDATAIVNGFDPTRPHVLQVRVVNENPLRPRFNQISGYTVYYVAPVIPGSYEEYNYDGSNQPVSSAFVYEEVWNKPITYTREPGPSGDHYIESRHPDARAYLYFSGADSATIYAATKSNMGAMDIYVNGLQVGMFYLKGRTGYARPYTITGLPPTGTNILELRVHQERGFAPRISLDRVDFYNMPALEPGTYENDELIDNGGFNVPALQFSGQWTTFADANASGGAYTVSASIDDKVVFEVTNAQAVTIYRRLYRRYGMADVYVDGQYHSSFDNTDYSRLGTYQAPYTIGGLDPGFNHQIEIRSQPYGRKMNQAKPFDIDYIEVLQVLTGGINFLENAYYENDHPTALGGGAIAYAGATWVHGTESRGQIKGERAIVTFKGNAFSVFLNYRRLGGWVQVLIDGEDQGRFLTKAWPEQMNVPISFVNLDPNVIHTAEILVFSRYVYIDAFQAQTMVPDAPQLYDLVNGGVVNDDVVLSGLWTTSGESLRTRSAGASIAIHTTGADSLFALIDKLRGVGDIQFYVNGELYSTADKTYINRLTTTTDVFTVSGLIKMRTAGYWLEVRNPKALWVSLQELRTANLTPRLTFEDDIEAESGAIFPAGYWRQMPGSADANHSGGYFLQSFTPNSRLYLPVENVTYVTIYRPTARAYGDAAIYVDSEYWGVMPNSSSRPYYQVPFAIGPLTAEQHIIELRSTGRRGYGVDRVTLELRPPLDPGYYENDHIAFVGGTDGSTTYAPAYFGPWASLNDANASGGTLHRTRLRGSRLEAVFMGNEVTIYRRTSRVGKYMTAYIDGVAYPINNRTLVTKEMVPHTIPLTSNGPHSFELIADSGYVDLDGVEFKNTVPATFDSYQHDNTHVVVNDPDNFWLVKDSALHSEGSYIWTKTKYASVFLQFYGQRVTTYYTTGRLWGKMAFYLDGVRMDEIDLYAFDRRAPADIPFVEYDLPNLPEGLHVLEVRFEGLRRRGRPQANIDAFTVDGAPVPRPGEHTPPSEPDTGGDDIGDTPTEGCFEETHDEWVRVPDIGWFRPSA
ncbi:MAG: hypothetical protein JXQ72_06440, partial [Anaerolineae bacterium]|nr:hypothetical protein [Anaerolineae bacterium]